MLIIGLIVGFALGWAAKSRFPGLLSNIAGQWPFKSGG